MLSAATWFLQFQNPIVPIGIRKPSSTVLFSIVNWLSEMLVDLSQERSL